MWRPPPLADKIRIRRVFVADILYMDIWICAPLVSGRALAAAWITSRVVEVTVCAAPVAPATELVCRVISGTFRLHLHGSPIRQGISNAAQILAADLQIWPMGGWRNFPEDLQFGNLQVM